MVRLTPTYEEVLAQLERNLLNATSYVRLCPENIHRPVFDDAVAIMEKVLVTHGLHRARGNKVQAAAFLGINRNTLRSIMKRMGIRSL